MARFEVVAGRAIGMSILLDDELLIGRHADGAGRLADDDEISRSHARISLDRSGFCAIEDLGSTNGTFVNGLRINGPADALGRGHDRGRRHHPGRARAADPAFRAHAQGGPAAAHGRAGTLGPAPSPSQETPASRSARRHVRSAGRARPSDRRQHDRTPRTAEPPGAEPSTGREAGRRLPTACRSSSTSTSTRARPPVALGDEPEPLRLVFDGDAWRPARPDAAYARLHAPTGGCQQPVPAAVEQQRLVPVPHLELEHLADEDQVVARLVRRCAAGSPGRRPTPRGSASRWPRSGVAPRANASRPFGRSREAK